MNIMMLNIATFGLPYFKLTNVVIGIFKSQMNEGA